MEKTLSPSIRKWVKKCLKEEFEDAVLYGLENEKSKDVIADDIMHSKEMEGLVRSMKNAFDEHRGLTSGRNSTSTEFRPRTSLSFGSDISSEDWSPFKGSADQYAYVIEKISYDKPVHVRLAGYERLLESELSNVGNSESWDILLKTLRDGIADESRPVFEASLRVHAKLLNSPRSHDVYTNLLSAFNAQYHSRKLHDILPTLNTGINFKIFLHEKLFRVMRLIVHHQEEFLKSIRTIDRVAEEMIEQFVIFLSSHTFGNSMQAKTLNPLNILSVLEPQAGWSRKWIHGLATRKTLTTVLSKSPSLLESIMTAVSKGLEKPPKSMAFTVTDEPVEVFISGDSVETATYLHGLNFLAQLSSYSAGRALLSESTFESTPSPSDFAIALLNSLNAMASSATTSGVYNASRDALRYMLEKSTTVADAKFYHVAMSPLMRSSNGEGKIWAHTLDTLNHMIETKDGVTFVTGDHRNRSENPDEPVPRCPAVVALEHVAGLLRQPFSVMNIEHVVQLFQFVGRLLEVHEIHEIVEDTLRNEFFPAMAYLYSKMDKYAVGHESKTQYLDRCSNEVLFFNSSQKFLETFFFLRFLC